MTEGRRFEDLAKIELASTSSFQQWTTTARELEQAMGWECNFAGNVITGALRPLAVVGGGDGFLRGEINSAMAAKRIGGCFQRAAEHHISAAKLLTKAYSMFEIYYLESRAKPNKPTFRLDG